MQRGAITNYFPCPLELSLHQDVVVFVGDTREVTPCGQSNIGKQTLSLLLVALR